MAAFLFCPGTVAASPRTDIQVPSRLGWTVLTFSAMTSRLSRWLNDPLILMIFAAGLLAFAVQSRELGTADTMHRLQTTHSPWTSQPQVLPSEYPEFGIHGRK